MRELTLPMRSLSLSEVLADIPDNEWTWSFTFFWGVGVAPKGLSMEEFEQEVSQQGYTTKWPALVEFASQLEQIIDCDLSAYALNDGGGDTKLIKISAVDSHSWEISVPDSNESLQSWLSRLEEQHS